MENLFFTDKGSGTPVVLLHGFCQSHIIWDELSNELSSSFRLLCPDLPGFGQNGSLEKSNYGLEEVSNSINTWLEELGIDKCILIGHSLGGYITLSFAEGFPEKLLGFGLFHSTSYEDTPAKKETRNKVISFLESHGANEFTDTFVPGLFYHKSEEIQKNIDILVEDARSCSKESLIAYTRAMRDRPDRSHLLNMAIPILFICGEKDGAVPIEQSRLQTRELDPKFIHFLSQTGHMGMFERKEETSKMVSDFLHQFAS
jgi:pimeloyl-ACP methyl ester carboxylesterase